MPLKHSEGSFAGTPITLVSLNLIDTLIKDAAAFQAAKDRDDVLDADALLHKTRAQLVRRLSTLEESAGYHNLEATTRVRL